VSQPSTEESTQDNDRSSSILCHTTYLTIASVAASVLVTLLLLDGIAPAFDVSRGVYALLAGLSSATFMGYLVRSAQAELARQNELKAANDAKRFREVVEDVYSVAFTDVVAGGSAPRRIDSVNGRSKFPTHG
jgi:hypothetical protein